MLMGRKAKPESPEEMAMVHHALENPTRRRMLILMNEGLLTVDEIAQEVGDRMLDYQLHRMELAGLLEIHDGQITLTEAGVAYGRLVKLEKDKGGADKIMLEDLQAHL
ncbi:winged helix-turn-helix domain-containing protein [Methanothrix sp.]|uniref:winged helix-turn-helix domain-containing protein n=1 Tax=Methanothrix sp. TaxID=90426 RepID=UPI003C718F2F